MYNIFKLLKPGKKTNKKNKTQQTKKASNKQTSGTWKEQCAAKVTDKNIQE